MSSDTIEKLKLRKRMERAGGSLALKMAVGPIRLLKLPAARKLGRGLGLIVYTALGRYRRVAHKNLKLIFGDALSESERTRLARDVFSNFGETAAEFVKLPQLDREQIDALTQVEGEENLKSSLEQNKGTLIITGHFGNWEFLARWFAVHNYPLSVIARRADNPEAEKLAVQTRTQSGSQVYNRGNSARPVLQSLHRNELVGILPDQNAGNIVAPFLGLQTGTTDGPAIFHLHTGSPIVFSWCTREPDGRFKILFEPPEIYTPTGDKQADILAIMSMINAHLGEQIRKRPSQWLWLHDRWRASPWVFENGKDGISLPNE